MAETAPHYDYAKGKTLEELKAEIRALLIQMQRASMMRRSGLNQYT